MASNSLDIRTAKEAEKFDDHLDKFQERRNAPPISHISLKTVFLALQGIESRQRLFTYMLELKLQWALINCDLCKIIDLQCQASPQDPLHDVDTFCNRTELLKANSDFIFRYRAMWDKVMAVIVLLFNGKEFQRFEKSKSKKKAFRKILADVKAVPKNTVDYIMSTTEDFDSQYRTKESHGSGSTRKWSYDCDNTPFSNQGKMFWANNALNSIMLELGKMFNHILEEKNCC